MTIARIAALIFAILLFFPGGCFLAIGVISSFYGTVEDAVSALGLAALLLALVGFLGWIAFRKPKSSADGG